MFYLFIVVYSVFIVPFQYIAFTVGSVFNKKIKQGFIGRLGGLRRFRNFSSTLNISDKTILIHSSSVGEWEQSVQIIRELKKNHSNLKFVATFFSPSGYNIVKDADIDFKMYLPYDDPIHSWLLFKILKPKCWVISKYDLWPNSVCAAYLQNIPTILASAELAEDSTRHKGILGYFNKLFYSKLDHILPISDEYLERFKLIYNKPDSLIVTGDARCDQIFNKAEDYSTKEPIQLFSNALPTVICGSTWPKDEKVLFPSFANLLANKKCNVVIVPHEIEKKHNDSIESFFNDNNFSTSLYTELEDEVCETDVLIVDTIGLLAKLYQSADIVYVGGSFSSGVHNVLEPAAFSNPIFFGPKHKNSYEAKQLVKSKAATSISTSEEFTIGLTSLLNDKELRVEKGQLAKQYLIDNLGAAKKTADIIEKYL